MTPVGYYIPYLSNFMESRVFNIYDTGMIGDYYVYSTEESLRPVINLKSNVVITGTGTMTDPYIVN